MLKFLRQYNINLLCREESVKRRTLAVLFACFSTVFASYAVRYSYGCLLPEMLPSLSITKAEAGIIFAAYFIAYTVFAPVLGLVGDRFNSRITITIFIVVMGIGTYLMQHAVNVLQAAVYFSFVGVGSAACWAPVLAVAQRWINSSRRGLSLAVIDAGSSIGVISAGAFIPLIVSGGHWQNGWFALAIMTFIIAVINFLFLRDHPKEKISVQVQLSTGTGFNYKALLTDRRFWFIGTAYVFNCLAVIIPFTFLSTYAAQELSFNYASAAFLVTVIGITGTAGKLVLGPLSDKTGRIKMILLCALSLGGGCLGMSLSDGWSLFVFAGLFGIGYGACWSLYAACAGDFFPGKPTGLIIGLWTCYSGIGSIFGPVAGGLAADVSGTLTWAFAIGAAGGIGSLLLLLPMLKDPQAK